MGSARLLEKGFDVHITAPLDTIEVAPVFTPASVIHFIDMDRQGCILGWDPRLRGRIAERVYIYISW